MKNESKSFFYCYSVQLKNWLKLNGIHFATKGRHKNGNFFWVFERDEKLDKALNDWIIFKRIFKKQGE